MRSRRSRGSRIVTVDIDALENLFELIDDALIHVPGSLGRRLALSRQETARRLGFKVSEPAADKLYREWQVSLPIAPQTERSS